MKNPIKLYTVIVSVLIVALPFNMAGQEKEMKVRIKTVKVVDGKKEVTDTTYTLSGDEDFDEVVNKFNTVADTSTEAVIVKVFVESDEDGEIIFDMDEDYKIIMKDLEGELEGLKEMCMELKGISELGDAGFMEKMIEIETIVEPDGDFGAVSHKPRHAVFFEGHSGDNSVSDRELREAGIKNKADRLVTGEMNIDIDKGVVDLSFTLKTEGAPKVVVYNFFGDKVFTGKPGLTNGKYQLKMDMSAKQHGVYYLQVVQKNSSFTEKLKL